MNSDAKVIISVLLLVIVAVGSYNLGSSVAEGAAAVRADWKDPLVDYSINIIFIHEIGGVEYLFFERDGKNWEAIEVGEKRIEHNHGEPDKYACESLAVRDALQELIDTAIEERVFGVKGKR